MITGGREKGDPYLGFGLFFQQISNKKHWKGSPTRSYQDHLVSANSGQCPHSSKLQVLYCPAAVRSGLDWHTGKTGINVTETFVNQVIGPHPPKIVLVLALAMVMQRRICFDAK